MSKKKSDIRELNPDSLIKALEDAGLKGDIQKMFLEDIENGFELNKDNTIDMVKYCAWLVIKSQKRKVK